MLIRLSHTVLWATLRLQAGPPPTNPSNPDEEPVIDMFSTFFLGACVETNTVPVYTPTINYYT